ncbi:LysE family translocator [Corticicoccus populi]|uniref:LysE family translocator n=1 Tax=Corticicoccus populi TaxID=1812821 RepID=A0ABW5WV50_9STAP
MELLTILSFAGAAMLVTIMPGPDNLFVLTQSIAKGKNAGIFTTLGLCTGLLLHVSAAAIGITALLYQSAAAFTIIKYAGAVYLLYLAYMSFRNKESTLNLDSGERLNSTALYRRGVIMNVLNPKVSLFFLAFFPQFVNNSGINISVQMLLLGIIFLVQTFIIFSLISLFSGKIGTLLRQNPAVSKRMNIIQGCLFTAIGLSIAFND